MCHPSFHTWEGCRRYQLNRGGCPNTSRKSSKFGQINVTLLRGSAFGLNLTSTVNEIQLPRLSFRACSPGLARVLNNVCLLFG